MAPPPVPNSPAGSRKLSLQPQGLYSRQPEPLEQNRQFKFGETKLRSPSPSRNAMSRNGTVERKVSGGQSSKATSLQYPHLPQTPPPPARPPLPSAQSLFQGAGLTAHVCMCYTPHVCPHIIVFPAVFSCIFVGHFLLKCLGAGLLLFVWYFWGLLNGE